MTETSIEWFDVLRKKSTGQRCRIENERHYKLIYVNVFVYIKIVHCAISFFQTKACYDKLQR